VPASRWAEGRSNDSARDDGTLIPSLLLR